MEPLWDERYFTRVSNQRQGQNPVLAMAGNRYEQRG